MFGWLSLLVSLVCFLLYWFGANVGSPHDLLAAGFSFFVLGHMIDGAVGYVRNRGSSE